jgi:hypothetical protein
LISAVARVARQPPVVEMEWAAFQCDGPRGHPRHGSASDDRSLCPDDACCAARAEVRIPR